MTTRHYAAVAACGIAGLLGAGAIAANAASGGGVARSQMETLHITADFHPGNTHSFDVTVNPCDGTFSGSGVHDSTGEQESVVGTYVDGALNFTSTYVSGPESPGLTGLVFTYSADVVNGSFSDGEGLITAGPNFVGDNPTGQSGTVTVTDVSNYKNHGQYVSSTSGGSDAGHSCVGMPVQSNG